MQGLVQALAAQETSQMSLSVTEAARARGGPDACTDIRGRKEGGSAVSERGGRGDHQVALAWMDPRSRGGRQLCYKLEERLMLFCLTFWPSRQDFVQ